MSFHSPPRRRYSLDPSPPRGDRSRSPPRKPNPSERDPSPPRDLYSPPRRSRSPPREARRRGRASSPISPRGRSPSRSSPRGRRSPHYGSFSPKDPRYRPPVEQLCDTELLWFASWVVVARNIKQKDDESFFEYIRRLEIKAEDIVDDTVGKFSLKGRIEGLKVLTEYIPARQLTFVLLTGTDTIIDVVKIFKNLEKQRKFSVAEYSTMMKYLISVLNRFDVTYYDGLGREVMGWALWGSEEGTNVMEAILELYVNLTENSISDIERNIAKWRDNLIAKFTAALKDGEDKTWFGSETRAERAASDVNELFRMLTTVLAAQHADDDRIYSVFKLVNLKTRPNSRRVKEVFHIVKDAPLRIVQRYIADQFGGRDERRPTKDDFNRFRSKTVPDIVMAIIDFGGDDPYTLLKWIDNNKYFDMINGVLEFEGNKFTPFEYAIDGKQILVVEFFQHEFGVRMDRDAWRLAEKVGIAQEIRLLRPPQRQRPPQRPPQRPRR